MELNSAKDGTMASVKSRLDFFEASLDRNKQFASISKSFLTNSCVVQSSTSKKPISRLPATTSSAAIDAALKNYQDSNDKLPREVKPERKTSMEQGIKSDITPTRSKPVRKHSNGTKAERTDKIPCQPLRLATPKTKKEVLRKHELVEKLLETCNDISNAPALLVDSTSQLAKMRASKRPEAQTSKIQDKYTPKSKSLMDIVTNCDPQRHPKQTKEPQVRERRIARTWSSVDASSQLEAMSASMSEASMKIISSKPVEMITLPRSDEGDTQDSFLIVDCIPSDIRIVSFDDIESLTMFSTDNVADEKGNLSVDPNLSEIRSECWGKEKRCGIELMSKRKTLVEDLNSSLEETSVTALSMSASTSL